MVSFLLAAAGLAQPGLWCRAVSEDFPSFPETRIIQYDRVRPSEAFQDAIVSWNVSGARNAAVDVEARAHIGARTTKWYQMGTWTYDLLRGPRQSIDGQADADGNVLTDTLRLKEPADTLDLRFHLRTIAPGNPPRLKFVSVATSPLLAQSNDIAFPSPAWGKMISVPKRFQDDYWHGEALCSPTSTSMVLAYWAKKLGRPEMDQQVPCVMAGVWDSVYGGAGNWPFNAACVGAIDGMRAMVARFNNISTLEGWIENDCPVVCSVSYSLVRGRPRSSSDGHLIVLVGFTRDGDPVFNDPAQRGQVQTTYKRADFERAWKTSNRAVYLIYPESLRPPYLP